MNQKEQYNKGIVIPDNIKNSSIGNLKECINLFSDVSNIYILGTVNILEDNLESKVGEIERYFFKSDSRTKDIPRS